VTGNTDRHQLVRMVVQDALHVGSRLVDRGVYSGLAVGLAEAFELLSMHVEDNQIPQHHLPRRHMRRAEDPVAGQPRRNMSVDVDHTLVLQYLASQHHFFF
jgi:hypothetical protein